MASFAIGRYVPYNSFLHRLDPRSKLFAVIALMVAVFFDYPSWSMRATMMGALFLFFCFLLFSFTFFQRFDGFIERKHALIQHINHISALL